jgi:hypothetical protein
MCVSFIWGILWSRSFFIFSHNRLHHFRHHPVRAKARHMIPILKQLPAGRALERLHRDRHTPQL